MINVLHGLYRGTLIPWERREPKNDALLEIIRKIEEEERYFAGKMPPNDCSRFQALSKLYTDLSAIEEENAFSYGFSFGLLLTLDVMEEAKSMTDT